QNLLFLPNITESAFDTLNLEALLAAAFDPSQPSFSLSPSTSADFPGLPDPDLGRILAAEFQLLDPSDGVVVGAFAAGVESVPEPAPVVLMLMAAALVLPLLRIRLRAQGMPR